MNNEQAQQLAPSYLRMPDDGAKFKCSICKQYFHHSKMIKPFTPDKVVHYCQCVDCTDETWLANAKDCGVAE